MVRVNLTPEKLREMGVSEEAIAEIGSKGVRVGDQGESESKYRNKACSDELFGTKEWFQSDWERQVWYRHMTEERDGQIRNLRRQVPYPIAVNEHKITSYVADFVFEEKRGEGDLAKWVEVVEDAKGVVTEVFRLKAKLMLAVYGIRIRETFKEAR